MEHESASPRSYYLVYAALMVLLVLTVAAGQIRLGVWSLLIALTIAAVKAALVILYFMHVRYNSRLTWLFAAAGFVWLSVLIGLMMTDYASRGWIEAP